MCEERAAELQALFFLWIKTDLIQILRHISDRIYSNFVP